MSNEPVLLHRPATLSAALHGLVARTRVVQNNFGRNIEYLLDPAVGRGRIEYIDAGPEMWMFVVDCVLRRELRFRVADAGLLRFNFGLSLAVQLRLAGVGDVVANEPSWRLLYNPPRAITIETYPKDVPARWLTVVCHPHFIAQLTGVGDDELPALLQRATGRTDPDVAVHHPYRFCARMRTATVEVLRARIAGPARISYIRARCTELLCLAATHLLRADGMSSRTRVSERDRRIFSRIKAQIDANYLRCPSNAEICRQHGINRNKLFYGFKELYGVSVADYARDLRIVEGQRLLIETDLPVAAISAKLGFAHPGNFSAAIKKLYGVAPMVLRSNHRSRQAS
jgi:AraC-like DNA-binding protein